MLLVYSSIAFGRIGALGPGACPGAGPSVPTVREHNISYIKYIYGAAILQEPDAVRGKTVAAIVTGGNVDTDVFAAVLQGQTPKV